MIFKNKQKNKKNYIFYLMFGSFVFKLLFFIFKKKKAIKSNFKIFKKEEIKEIDELKDGKESFNKFWCDTGNIFKDFFVPHEGNNYKPKILHTRSLAIIVFSLSLLKIWTVAYLFFIYPNQAEMQNQINKEILVLINKERINNNLSELKENKVLDSSALAKADDMIINNYFAHYSPNGKKPWDWISRAVYPYLFIGENLAMNFTSAESVHNALMQSPSHKKNILNEKYSDIGLAVVSGKIDGKNTNILVQLFGSENNNIIDKKVVIANKSNEIKIETKTANKIITPEIKQEKNIDNQKKIINHRIINKTEDIKIGDIKKNIENIEDIKYIEKNKDKNINKNIISNNKPIGVLAVDENFKNNFNEEIIYKNPVENKKIGIATKIVSVFQNIYIGFLIILIISLFANILIKINVQHKPVITQTILSIIVIIGLISIHFHTLENISKKIMIL